MAASRTKISILATARPSFYIPFSGSNLRKFRQKSRGRTSTAPLYRVAVCDRFGGNRRPKLETKSSTDPPKGRGSLSPFRLLVGFLQCWFFFCRRPISRGWTQNKRKEKEVQPRAKKKMADERESGSAPAELEDTQTEAPSCHHER